MAWSPTGLAPVEITVDGRIDGQQIVNKFYLKCEFPGAGLQDGDLLLANWVDNYRARILGISYNWYSVFRYTMREIAGIALIPGSDPARYRPVYSIAGISIQAGVVADTGANAIGVGALRLPVHECIRVFKEPAERRLKYFKGNYNRFGGWTTDEKDPVAEIWSAAVLTAFDIQFKVFNDAHVASNVPGTITWLAAVWSSNYFATLIPTPQTNAGALISLNYISDKYVGTQISRRYSPSGQYKGR